MSAPPEEEPFSYEGMDVLDLIYENPACPRCGTRPFGLDTEFHAWICDECGLWREDDGDSDGL